MSLKPPTNPTAGAPSLLDTFVRDSDAANPTNTDQMFFGTGGYTFAGTGIPHQGTPISPRISVGGIYDETTGGNIFQFASYAYNSRRRSTVAVFGEAKGSSVWGGNFVGYADTATTDGVPTAIGVEIDFGLIGTGQAGSVATGLLLAAAGGNSGAPQNDGAYIQLQANNSLSPVKNGLKIHKSGSDEPLTSDGSGILFNNISTAFGINFGSSTFTTNAIQFGPGNNIGISNTTGTKIGSNGSLIGFYGATPVARRSAMTQTYSTADRTLSAYTPDVESAAYTGAADGEAKLADLNALRVAYENLRAFTEDLAQFVNAAVDDQQALGFCT